MELQRVLVIAREPVGRLGIKAVLEREGLEMATAVATCADAIDSLARSTPDVILVARLTDRQPVTEDVKQLHAAAPAVPIVVLSSRAASKELAAAVDAGAASWVSARASTAEIAAALRTVSSGLVVFSRSSARALLDGGNQVEPGQPAPTRVPVLTPVVEPHSTRPRTLSDRERELLRLLGSGQNSTEIAETMGLSVDTVRRSVRALTEKLAGQFGAVMRDEIA